MKRLLLALPLLLGLVAGFQPQTRMIVPGSATLPAVCGVRELYFKTTATIGLYACTATNTWTLAASDTPAAPSNASFWTRVAESTLSNETAMGALGTGLIVNTTTTGVPLIYNGSTCTTSFVRSLNASGVATCQQVLLSADVAGNLPVTNLNGGLNADSSHFWRGDGIWASVSGAGDFSTNTATSVVNEVVLFADTTGKLGKRSTLTGLGLFTSGVLSAYAGVTCTNQFVRSLSASGVGTCNTVSLTADVTGTLPVANGGTGLTSGTSGGILGYTAAGTLASSVALTVSEPVIGGGAGATPTSGTRQGNTTKFVTYAGSAPGTNECAKFDASGNLTTNGVACGGGGGSGTVTNTGTLTANALMLGNGGVDITALGSLGTTTTVLHGNAAGAPSFAAVSLTADVTGDLPFANLTQIAGLSVLGVTGSSTADVAAITASTDRMVLQRVSSSSMAFSLIGVEQWVFKAGSDESVTSSAALQSDNELVFALGANTDTYEFTFHLEYLGPTAGDIKFAFNVPTAATGSWGANGLATTAASNTGSITTFSTTDLTDTGAGSYGCGGTTFDGIIELKLRVVNGGNSGNVTLRWAQDSSNGTATTIRGSNRSYIKAVRIQ